MVAVNTLGGVNEYVPKHLQMRKHDDELLVVCCLHCGGSEQLSPNAVLALDELQDFRDAHIACPRPAA